MAISEWMPQSWVPSIKELLLFLLIVILTLSMVFLFYFTGVHSRVQKNSRCIREQKFVSGGGQYSMTAVDPQNNPLYTVTYDLAGKSFDLACACKEGEIVNRFTNIRVYNQKNPKSPNMTIPEKLCQCNQSYDQAGRVYYTGYPGLLRYYDNGDTSLFQPRPY